MKRWQIFIVVAILYFLFLHKTITVDTKVLFYDVISGDNCLRTCSIGYMEYLEEKLVRKAGE